MARTPQTPVGAERDPSQQPSRTWGTQSCSLKEVNRTSNLRVLRGRPCPICVFDEMAASWVQDPSLAVSQLLNPKLGDTKGWCLQPPCLW